MNKTLFQSETEQRKNNEKSNLLAAVHPACHADVSEA